MSFKVMEGGMMKLAGFCIIVLCGLSVEAIAAVPTISVMPVVSSDTVVADDTTQYTVSMTATDGNGYDDLRDMRVLFNYSEASPNETLGRGYLVWGKTDADVTRYSASFVLADASGGGRWGYAPTLWGGTTYITPLACSVTTSGSATGGSGTRTVTWTFTAKPAWASNPLINDADAFVADYSTNVGWKDNPAFFDVVAQACAGRVATPETAVLSNPTATTVDVAIDSGDSNADLFAIRVSPSHTDQSFVQADGTLGVWPVWRTKAAWGTTTVTGLAWNTTYTFTVRATGATPELCPSPFGPAAQVTTDAGVQPVNVNSGVRFNPAVRGQNPYRMLTVVGGEACWDLAIGASGRGLAGGLDADTYDWRNVESGSNWGAGGAKYTTLEFLQLARDHGSVPFLTANMFGGGYKMADGTFYCETANPEGLAADWVRYTNILIQNYRLGEEGTLTGENARVYASIADWDGRPQLLAPDEGAAPKVIYWEIGNEPEVPGVGTMLTNHYLSPADYLARYKTISAAMRSVDATLKIGPCLTSTPGCTPWIEALAADPAARIDFIGYHPYYLSIQNRWGDVVGMANALRDYKAFLAGKSAAVRDAMAQHGRTNYGLAATEWNPLNWDATSTQQRSMAMALGVVEGVFTFAEDEHLAAHFWEGPQDKASVKAMFEALRDHMGDTLIASSATMGSDPSATLWRVYVTKDSAAPAVLTIWGLNFSDSDPAHIDLSLAGSVCAVRSATLKRYGIPGGDTSLMSSSGLGWTVEDVTAGFDLRNFRLTMHDAEVTLLVLQITPVPDFDNDGDVDLAEFGFFQFCFNGPNRSALYPECVVADTDSDGDVDLTDFSVLQMCFNGPNRPPACG